MKYFLLIILIFYAEGIAQPTVPTGFVVEEIPHGSQFRTVQVVFFPGGNRALVDRGGVVKLYNSSSQFIDTLADLSAKVLNEYDKGLLSVAIDPDFETNKWVYFLYIVDPDSDNNDNDATARYDVTPPPEYYYNWGRLERYQMSYSNPDKIDLTTRQILFGATVHDGMPYVATDGSHGTGTILFGDDKTLIISLGDGANYSSSLTSEMDPGGLNPNGFQQAGLDTSLDMGALRAQSIYNFCGKILRINKETGQGLPSNPFWNGDPNSIQSKVWVYGLRNPFRIAIKRGSGAANPDSGKPGVLFITDVGLGSVEELNISKNGGENFGWPLYEGPVERTEYTIGLTEAFNGNFNVLNPGGNNENPVQPVGPVLHWFHKGKNTELSNPQGWMGNAAIAGTFYTGSTYPEKYRNNFFVADYVEGWIRVISFDEEYNVASTDSSDFFNFDFGPVDMTADPVSGDLFVSAQGNSSVWRISYPTGNHNPVIVASIDTLYGLAPLTVTGDATGTYDEDPGDVLTYEWDFDDSGAVGNTIISSHTYEDNGTYNITLTVTDDKGGKAVKVFPLVVGQSTPPNASILTPNDSSFFDLGESIIFSADSVSEDNGPVDYRWEFDFAHDTHLHDASFTFTGRTVNFSATVPHGESGSVYWWRVRLIVTQGSLINSDTVEIFPKMNLIPSLSFTPGDPPLNTSFEANIVIQNVGEVYNPLTFFNLYKGSQVILDAQEIQNIAPGGSISYDIPMGDMDSSVYEIKIELDPDNFAVETNEEDNLLIQYIYAGATPVELISFNGNYKANSVMLSWSTATEINNYGFEVERKVINSISNKETKLWSKIGFVEGHGNSNSVKNYTFVDKNLSGGYKYLYRLKQIDNDGTFKYLNEIEIDRGLPTEFSLSQNYPNPFNPVTTINYAIPVDEFVKLEVYSIIGDKIATLVNDKKNAGFYSETFNAENLPDGRQGLASGVYFYTLQAGKFKDVKKFILIK